MNFWNPDRHPVCDADLVTWSAVTTGGNHAVNLWLDDLAQAQLGFVSAQAHFDLDLSSMQGCEHVVECGGLSKRFRIQRLPNDPLPTAIDLSQQIAIPATGEVRICAKIVFEDGHMAWTSPVSIHRC